MNTATPTLSHGELLELRRGDTPTVYPGWAQITIHNAAAAIERGIPVTKVPTDGTISVAQTVFAHLLNSTQHAANLRAFRAGAPAGQSAGYMTLTPHPVPCDGERVLPHCGTGGEL